MKEMTFYLGYEATASLSVTPEEVVTPMATTTGSKLSESIAIIPILRAGLGMGDALLELLPKATVHHIGMYRSKNSLLPVQYYNRLPKGSACDIAYIVDPCIATSGTLHAVVAMVKKWGARKVVVVSVIASRPGIERLASLHPDINIFVGAIDETLSSEGMIIPGLGDAGDRLYSTPQDLTPVTGGAAGAEGIASPVAAGKRKAGSV